MKVISPLFADVDIRSYGETRRSGRHGFAQLVLPVSGELQLDIEGAQKKLNPLHGAVVPAGAWHSQRSVVDNRSLILDVDQAAIMQGRWQCLLDRRFTAISAAARKLIQFMQISVEGGTAQPALVRAWVPLLLDTMALGTPRVGSRLTALLAQIEANPSLPWTTHSMAQFARMSVSRLHALFREEFDISPHAWLLHKRLDLACELLTYTGRTITDIALSTGFSEQSVLTRAMRQHMDITPAAYRRLQQETAPK